MRKDVFEQDGVDIDEKFFNMGLRKPSRLELLQPTTLVLKNKLSRMKILDDRIPCP